MEPIECVPLKLMLYLLHGRSLPLVVSSILVAPLLLLSPLCDHIGLNYTAEQPPQ